MELGVAGFEVGQFREVDGKVTRIDGPDRPGGRTGIVEFVSVRITHVRDVNGTLWYVRNGEITLNVSPSAVHKLQMGNELIEFSARFAGVARQISVPVACVYALYARETGHGMTFEVDAARPAAQAEAEREAGPEAGEGGQERASLPHPHGVGEIRPGVRRQPGGGLVLVVEEAHAGPRRACVSSPQSPGSVR